MPADLLGVRFTHGQAKFFIQFFIHSGSNFACPYLTEFSTVFHEKKCNIYRKIRGTADAHGPTGGALYPRPRNVFHPLFILKPCRSITH